MIQVQESGDLGKGQIIETDMTQLESLKIFRVVQGRKKPYDSYEGPDEDRAFDDEDAAMVSTAVEKWLQTDKKNLETETIELRMCIGRPLVRNSSVKHCLHMLG